MSFYLYEDVEVGVYFHDEGEEYFLHYDYWPSMVPPRHHIGKQEQMLEILVTKEVTISDEDCKWQANLAIRSVL